MVEVQLNAPRHFPKPVAAVKAVEILSASPIARDAPTNPLKTHVSAATKLRYLDHATNMVIIKQREIQVSSWQNVMGVASSSGLLSQHSGAKW